MLAGDEPYPTAALRSGRDGISFSPANMLFVPGGATLEQSITKPQLRVPGLRGWIEALAAQRRPGTAAEPGCWRGIVPIPGTRRLERLQENIGADSIELTAEELENLEAINATGNVEGVPGTGRETYG